MPTREFFAVLKLNALVAEFIGTFMLVFVGAGAVTFFVANQPNGDANIIIAALAHSLILVGIIATFGHISGAHVNPAVSLGVTVAGKMNPLAMLVYWVAQFAGGIAAAALIRYIYPNAAVIGQTTPAAGIDGVKVLILEALMTFFLVSTVIQAAVYGKAGNLAALVIPFTLAGAILLGGALTGASLNPARTLGPALISGQTPEIVFYMVGIFGGGAVAGLLHSVVFRQA